MKKFITIVETQCTSVSTFFQPCGCRASLHWELLCVGVEATEKEIDAEVGDDDREEGEDEIPIEEAWIAEDWQ